MELTREQIIYLTDVYTSLDQEPDRRIIWGMSLTLFVPNNLRVVVRVSDLKQFLRGILDNMSYTTGESGILNRLGTNRMISQLMKVKYEL